MALRPLNVGSGANEVAQQASYVPQWAGGIMCAPSNKMMQLLLFNGLYADIKHIEGVRLVC